MTAAYFENPRTDIVAHFPTKKFSRVLDLGCGAGTFSSWLKQQGHAGEVVGVEFHAAAAAAATKKLDQVHHLSLDEITEIPPAWGKFDLILCFDVLEHLRDPWKTLSMAKSALNRDGEILLSIPNVRNFRVVVPLVLRGTWKYEDSGLLDRTHLRFFTKASVQELIAGAGLEVVDWQHSGMRPGSFTFFANLLTFGFFRGFFELQYIVRAKPRKEKL